MSINVLINVIKLSMLMISLGLAVSCGESDHNEKSEQSTEFQTDQKNTTTDLNELEVLLNNSYQRAYNSINYDFSSLPDSLRYWTERIKSNLESEKTNLKNMFDDKYKTLKLQKSDPDGDFEEDQLNTIIKHYHNLIRELNVISDIYSGAKQYSKYFKELNLIRMVRTVPSLSDTLHIILVLDQTDNNDLRKFVFLEQTPTKTRELINSDSLMVSRGMSGRMDDMLIDIYTQNDLFTMVIFHGGNWAHGTELTYGKYKNSFKLQNGVGFNVTKLNHSDHIIESVLANLYFFEQGSALKDMIYGETPDITGDYQNIDIEQTKRFFKYLEVY